MKLFNRKKGELLGALNLLPAAAIVVVVSILIITVGFKTVVGLQSTMTVPASGTSAVDNWTYNNITSMLGGYSQFASQMNLIVTIIVMSIIIGIVVSAFKPNQRY
jgi:hypothetical protein